MTQVAVIKEEADNGFNAFLSLPVTSHYSSCSCNNLAPHVPRRRGVGSVGRLRHERVGGQPRLIVISPQAAGQQTVPIKTACFCCQHHEVWLYEHDTCRMHRRSPYKNDMAARLLTGALLKRRFLRYRQKKKLSKRNKYLHNMKHRGWFGEKAFQNIIINSECTGCNFDRVPECKKYKFRQSETAKTFVR
jgi:hypothetical protein